MSLTPEAGHPSPAPSRRDVDPDVQLHWESKWPEATAAWSRFVRLHPPRFCLSEADERREGLTGSFAMIRLDDHAVVISLRQVCARGVERFPVEIMAHEVGHHIYCPGDLGDHGRMLARMRHALPTREDAAPLVANLYADLLLNDRLQRRAGLRMDAVYAALSAPQTDTLWLLYMRMYEVLWSLPAQTLAQGEVAPEVNADAMLGARVVRAFSSSWLDGAGRFAALLLPYLMSDGGARAKSLLDDWLDTDAIGQGDAPAGLAEMEAGEVEGAMHPRDDPAIGREESEGAADAGYDDDDDDEGAREVGDAPTTVNQKGGHAHQRRYRGVVEYGELLAAMGLKLSKAEATRRYYKERALPHLIRYPELDAAQVSERHPEGLAPWDWGAPLAAADWFESVVKSPFVIPGVTTVQRTYGEAPGREPQSRPLNLYVGIDCSGSMPNPTLTLSYPSLAGCIVALSALRAGAEVKVVLSGEPGKSVQTDDFTRGEGEVLDMLTQYLGSGYAFGIQRLQDTFAPLEKRVHPAHILLITDSDIFSMLDNRHAGVPHAPERQGWAIAEAALAQAGGGGTMVLHGGGPAAYVARLEQMGWTVHSIASWEAIVRFAEAFSRRNWKTLGARRSKTGVPG